MLVVAGDGSSDGPQTDGQAEGVFAASPAASGPAGPLFEGQVGAHYLLTMLAEAEPRGLPGARIERVEFQRAVGGHPLDDVIVHGSTIEGQATYLEVQVKRTITFAPSDPVFRDVAGQLARAVPTIDRSYLRQQFAVATERTSAKIAGPYKDVLRWAREYGSATSFFSQLRRPKAASDDMRVFVETLRGHLSDSGTPNDDETLWHLLRRFNILHFDYAAPGSQSLELALDRCRQVLHADVAPIASALWSVLETKVLQAAAAGGERNRQDLVTELTVADSFRLAGSAHNRYARETLSEAARLTSNSLQRTIAGVSLPRTAQLANARAALEQGRYLEVRGAAGVGKSGVLGALVSAALIEGPAIVFTPERTPAGGWAGLKRDLRIELSPEAFLADLASDGAATLFIDNLDSFASPERRATVTDLVTAAADVPAMTVIVTARADFDRDTPSWLPTEAIQKLGRAPVVTIGELGDDEVEELKAAKPGLKSLLGDDHPAKSLARNLFRLSRLFEVGASANQLRSEVDLLDRWWQTGDGPAGEQMRERRRLLARLADGALGLQDRIETSAPAPAIDALKATGSIVEPRPDWVSFGHDTLRDWAVAARLHDEPERLAALPLDRPAPPSMSRGIELAARFSLERASTDGDWAHFLDVVSPSSAHGSWRRWSLIAILRSEVAGALLERASPQLFANGGALLRELIRTAIAVEFQPVAELFSDAPGLDLSAARDLYVAASRSCFVLAQWLAARQSDVPLEALPEIVDLFQGVATAALFMAPFAAILANPLADWLEELEFARDQSLSRSVARPRALDAFDYHELYRLATDVRHAFALLAESVPTRAQLYLQNVRKRARFEDIAEDILAFRGTLAKVAPVELADVTLQALIPADIDEHREARRMRDEAFNHVDHKLLPSSPAQGPFLELLTASPQEGLRVVRALVAHAVTYYFGDERPGRDSITIHFAEGPRTFPWASTYGWSRGHACMYALASALMALEAWGHQRIEAGDPISDVLADVLGPEGSPAAFLLVAVDLLISHWPKALAAAVPFLGSPQLLSLERTRQTRDQMPDIDFIGLGDFGPKEPQGPVKLASLRARISRGAALECLLPYALMREEADDARLRQLLSDAASELGPIDEGDTFDVPRFMARHALNILDPKNWQPCERGLEYVSPDEEARHLADIQAARADQTAVFNLEAEIDLALEDPSRASPHLAARAVAHAKQLQRRNGQPQDSLNSRQRRIASAAMLAARDGDDRLLASEESWIRGVFVSALVDADGDPVRGSRDGIQFNLAAIAAVGIGELSRRISRRKDRDWLLELASRPESDAAQGLAVVLPHIRTSDSRLVASILRIAFASQIRPDREWEDEDSDAVNAERTSRYRQRASNAVAAERSWLDGKTGEPAWPAFPRRKRYLRNAGRSEFDDDDFDRESDGETYVASQNCARWLRLMTNDARLENNGWLAAFLAEYAPWTRFVNGGGLNASAEVSDHLDDWNRIFFRLLARSLPQRKEADAIEVVAEAIDVPDESFFEITTELVRAIDALYFNNEGIGLDLYLKLRSVFATRLVRTRAWAWERHRDDITAEVHIGPAIGVMFFNNFGSFTPSEAYLLPKGILRVAPLLPSLEPLIADGPVPLTAFLTMNLLEVAPQAAHLEFFLKSALIWLKRQPDNAGLWIERGLGARLAQWLDRIVDAEPSIAAPDHPFRPIIDNVLGRLVTIGVPRAHRLEQKLSPVSG